MLSVVGGPSGHPEVQDRSRTCSSEATGGHPPCHPLVCPGSPRCHLPASQGGADRGATASPLVCTLPGGPLAHRASLSLFPQRPFSSLKPQASRRAIPPPRAPSAPAEPCAPVQAAGGHSDCDQPLHVPLCGSGCLWTLSYPTFCLPLQGQTAEPSPVRTQNSLAPAGPTFVGSSPRLESGPLDASCWVVWGPGALLTAPCKASETGAPMPHQPKSG